MVTLPKQFMATKYPGYFWNIETRTVFSLKSGVLKEMVFTKPSVFTNMLSGYRVSVNGHRRWLTVDYLNDLMVRVGDSEVPVYQRGKTYENAK